MNPLVHGAYLISLVVPLACLGLLDHRFKLALWHNRKATLLTLACSLGIFVIWDILGISLGIFSHGASQYTLPLRLLPEFPLEELFFLVLLTYTSLLLYRGAQRRWPRT